MEYSAHRQLAGTAMRQSGKEASGEFPQRR